MTYVTVEFYAKSYKLRNGTMHRHEAWHVQIVRPNKMKIGGWFGVERCGGYLKACERACSWGRQIGLRH